MFEAAELGRKVPRKEYKAREPKLREELLEAQGELRKAGFPVIVLFGGVDGAGKGETANLLNSWLDPRWMMTRAFGKPSDEERERPLYWRFWRDLPPKGHIGIFLSAWYHSPLLNRVHGKSDPARLEEELERLIAFERTLTDGGALIHKFWMHLGKDQQKKRFRQLEKDKLQRWRVTKQDWEHWKLYPKFADAAERIIMRTSTGNAPWTVVEGADENYRSLKVGEVLLSEMHRHLENRRAAEVARRVVEKKRENGGNGDGETAIEVEGKKGAAKKKPRATVLSRLDLTRQLKKTEYREELEKWQGTLNRLHRQARDKGVSTICVFEGWDAAGKGGAIRRCTASLDARAYQVIPIAAPTDEERAQHYLWRFWRHICRAGRFTFFDRSWYGRVLVERVEGFASHEDWNRAYGEINDFERELVDHGIVLLKFWIHISKDEQERRFKERELIPYKRWKLTDEDWRNRAKWDDYEVAAHELVARTSTGVSPWTLVEGNDKYYARIKVLKTVCAALEKALKG